MEIANGTWGPLVHLTAKGRALSRTVLLQLQPKVARVVRRLFAVPEFPVGRCFRLAHAVYAEMKQQIMYRLQLAKLCFMNSSTIQHAQSHKTQAMLETECLSLSKHRVPVL